MPPCTNSVRPTARASVPIATRRQYGRWCAERERRIAVARRLDFLLDISLRGQVRPIRNHGHDAVLANADEDVGFVANVADHRLPLS
jgi:transposase